MPCHDDHREKLELLQIANSEKQKANREKEKTERAEAMLCAVLTRLEKDGLFEQVMADVNWEEAGVAYPYAYAWWANHKVKDETRRNREAEAHRRKLAKEAQERQRQEVLAKLSPEERKILGVR